MIDYRAIDSTVTALEDARRDYRYWSGLNTSYRVDPNAAHAGRRALELTARLRVLVSSAIEAGARLGTLERHCRGDVAVKDILEAARLKKIMP